MKISKELEERLAWQEGEFEVDTSEREEELKKFNEKHADNGQFATAGGGAPAGVAEKSPPAEDKGKGEKYVPNPKGPKNNIGGSYRRLKLRVKKAGSGEEVHHMPNYETRALHPANGPAISMPKADHIKTKSYGNTRSALDYRDKQRRLVQAGKYQEAQQMDIDDLREQFGNKYDEHIKEMQNYTATLKINKRTGLPMNPTPKVVRRGDA